LDKIISLKDEFHFNWKQSQSQVADLQKENQKLLEERTSEAQSKENLFIKINSQNLEIQKL
jgi:hypothetical protein